MRRSFVGWQLVSSHLALNEKSKKELQQRINYKQIKTAHFAKSAIYPPVSKFCVNVTCAIIGS